MPVLDVDDVVQDSDIEDRFVRSVVGYKAFQISRKPGFSEADRADLQQELLTTVSEGLKSYNPELSPYEPFVRSLVNNQTRDILRRKKARKRRVDRVCSLNVDIQDGEGGRVELLQTIGQRELDKRIGRERRLSDEDLSDLKMDLQSVISKLDPIAQEIVQRQATQSVTEIASEMGISRSTLRDWMLEIRRTFEAAGFEKYFEK